jgi:hypothetical protein
MTICFVDDNKKKIKNNNEEKFQQQQRHNSFMQLYNIIRDHPIFTSIKKR